MSKTSKKEFNWVSSLPTKTIRRTTKYRPFVCKVLWIEDHILCTRAFKSRSAAEKFMVGLSGARIVEL